jgi:hypothetical protein
VRHTLAARTPPLPGDEKLVPVPVTMMQVGKVRMSVLHWFVYVPMRVWFAHQSIVIVPMMVIMHMAVLMLKEFVIV